MDICTYLESRRGLFKGVETKYLFMLAADLADIQAQSEAEFVEEAVKRGIGRFQRKIYSSFI